MRLGYPIEEKPKKAWRKNYDHKKKTNSNFKKKQGPNLV
jgi:hypothetical protein